MRVYFGNPLKRRPTNIYFDTLSIGISFFGGWKFAVMRGIDIDTMRKMPDYREDGRNETIWVKPFRGYKNQGWGCYYHTKH